jgi:hypothetical protein
MIRSRELPPKKVKCRAQTSVSNHLFDLWRADWYNA